MKLHHRARVHAFQALFEAEFGRTDAGLALHRETAPARRAAESDFADQLVQGVRTHREELDAIIRETAPLWPVEQMSLVDLSILRIALYELLFNNAAVPVGAVINEAVELAKRYGSDSSRRLINGILGTVSRSHLVAAAVSQTETEDLSGSL